MVLTQFIVQKLKRHVAK